MVNIKISLQRSDIMPLASWLNGVLTTFEASEWLDYYNCKYIVKKLLDKTFNIRVSDKPLNISFNINQLSTLSRIYAGYDLNNAPYMNNLLSIIMKQYHEQIMDLMHYEQIKIQQGKHQLSSNKLF